MMWVGFPAFGKSESLPTTRNLLSHPPTAESTTVMPAHELVDVLDADGNAVGVVTRREMRERRLPHRCTYILVFNAAGDLFIHLRTASKDVYPSHWDTCVGGVVAAGETFDEGAVRELREEIGVQTPLERLFPFRFEDERTDVYGMVYRAVHEGPFRLQPEEVVRGEFVPVEKTLRRIERDPFCPDGVEVLREAVARNWTMPLRHLD